MTTAPRELTTEQHLGHDCVRVRLAVGLVAWVTVDVGPRVIFLGEPDGENVLAELPDRTLDGPAGPFHLLGGHRLWTAPEVPARTYLPDDAACRLDTADGRVTVTAPDDGSGLERALGLGPVEGGIEIQHRLTNVASRPVEVASWAITQLPVGGMAILPLPARGPSAFEASHSLVLWPYTRLDDPRISFAPDHVVVSAVPGAEPIKLGSAPGSGRLGYLREGRLFVKQAAVPEPPIPDRGAASQVYAEAEFLELETLGQLQWLAPGESTGHTETWQVVEVEGIDEAVELVLR